MDIRKAQVMLTPIGVKSIEAIILIKRGDILRLFVYLSKK